jgi:hypothetical protein
MIPDNAAFISLKNLRPQKLFCFSSQLRLIFTMQKAYTADWRLQIFFNASFHLHCYRESSKAGVAKPGGLHSSRVSFICFFYLAGSFDSDCFGGAK